MYKNYRFKLWTNVFALINCLILALSTSALAIPVVTFNGNSATGVRGLVVEGVNLDVSFVNGSYDMVFGQTNPFWVGDAQGGVRANSALRAVLTNENVSDIEGFPGVCGVIRACRIHTPTEILSADVYVLFGIFRDFGANDWSILNGAGLRNINRPELLFAKYTRQVQVPQAPIPEPSTMLLFGTGLAGLGFWRWKKGKLK